MKTFIGILLVGLLGFSGCSSSDAESSPAYNVQAIGMVNGSELSVSAYVIDQEEQLSSDAMITINGEPMNIGFFVAEDLNMDQEDSLPDAIDQTVNGVRCGANQPYYFLNLLDVNEVDTVEFVAKGRQCSTFYSSSAVVPEKITIIEPSGDEPLPAGEPVIVRWEGGAPCSQFDVIYYRGSDGEMFSSGTIQGSTEFVMPALWMDAGWGVIFVAGCFPSAYDSQSALALSFGIGVVAEVYTATADSQSCRTQCTNAGYATYKACDKLHPPGPMRQQCRRQSIVIRSGCYKGCTYCPQ